MIIKGRSPVMRHVVRTHRVDLDWLSERIREDPGISIRFIETKNQLADILTKATFTSLLWNSLTYMAQIGPRINKDDPVAFVTAALKRQRLRVSKPSANRLKW